MTEKLVELLQTVEDDRNAVQDQIRRSGENHEWLDAIQTYADVVINRGREILRRREKQPK